MVYPKLSSSKTIYNGNRLTVSQCRISAGPDFYFTQFNRITGEMWTWILKGGIENMRKLTAGCVLLILSTMISAFMLYSMRRQWLRQRQQRSFTASNSFSSSIFIFISGKFNTTCILPPPIERP
jgi:hypothetical protein